MNDFGYFIKFTEQGKIYAQGRGFVDPDDSLCMITEGDCDHETNYVDMSSMSVLKRPVMVVSMTLSGFNIPAGTEVYVDGEMLGVCESGVLYIDKPNGVDRYQLKLVNFPYIDHEVML